MMESIYLIEACLLLLICSVAILCYQLSKLLTTLDDVYKREETLYRIRTGGMIDLNREVRPVRRKRY